MKGLLITHKGVEDIAALEIKELIGKKAIIHETCAIFDIKNHEDLFKLCYISQSSIGIYCLLSEHNHNNIFTDFKKNIENIDFSEWLSKKRTFRLKCTKNYEYELSTPELEEKFGAIIIEHIKKKYKYKQKVDLNNPDIILFVYLTKNKYYIGIDYAGFDLSKRTFNIFTHPAAIKGTIAYSLIRFSDYKRNQILLDPFSGSGTIPIEATLFASKFPINFYNRENFIFLKFDKFKKFNFEKFFESITKINDNKLQIYNVDGSMKNINFAKKNSKIAGIDKKLNFSRMDTEWLDTKFKKGKIDNIVTKMPLMKPKDMDKVYNEFFYQSEFILNKNGKITLIGNEELVKKYSSKYKFKIVDERSVFSGKEEYKIMVLTKSK